jgi:uncharacterized membrane protein YhdT
MKPQTKSAAKSAVKWALGLSAGYIIGPLIVNLLYPYNDTCSATPDVASFRFR